MVFHQVDFKLHRPNLIPYVTSYTIVWTFLYSSMNCVSLFVLSVPDRAEKDQPWLQSTGLCTHVLHYRTEETADTGHTEQ